MLIFWAQVVFWAVPVCFVLASLWFAAGLSRDAWAVARLLAGLRLRPGRRWAWFWRARRPESLMRFAVFRRWVP